MASNFVASSGVVPTGDRGLPAETADRDASAHSSFGRVVVGGDWLKLLSA